MIRLGLAAATLALASACADKPTTDSARNHILIVGSSTIYPFTRAVAEQFRKKHAGFAAPVVRSSGTTAGIEQFCGGIGTRYPDVVDASRRMTPEEFDACQANGVGEIAELAIGIDGIAFAQSPAAPPITLTRQQFYEAMAAQPYGKPNMTKRWKDVAPGLPDIPILIYGPPKTSGTRDALAELVMTAGCESDADMRALKAEDARRFAATCTTFRADGPYVDSGEDDERITQQLIVNPGAVGIFGYNFLEEKGDLLRGIPIDGTAPTAETIGSGRYAGARPLYVYVKRQHAGTVPGLKEFIAEYAAAIGPDSYLTRHGLVGLPEDKRAETRKVAASLAPVNRTTLQEIPAA